MKRSTVITTTVVHCKVEPRYDVYIGRPSKWGNPIPIVGSKNGLGRRISLKQHKRYLRKQPHLLDAIESELKGRMLGCYCKPKACHGDLLALLANTPREDWDVLIWEAE